MHESYQHLIQHKRRLTGRSNSSEDAGPLNWNASASAKMDMLNKLSQKNKTVTGDKITKDKLETIADTGQMNSRDELVYLESIGSDWLTI